MLRLGEKSYSIDVKIGKNIAFNRCSDMKQTVFHHSEVTKTTVFHWNEDVYKNRYYSIKVNLFINQRKVYISVVHQYTTNSTVSKYRYKAYSVPLK